MSSRQKCSELWSMFNSDFIQNYIRSNTAISTEDWSTSGSRLVFRIWCVHTIAFIVHVMISVSVWIPGAWQVWDLHVLDVLSSAHFYTVCFAVSLPSSFPKPLGDVWRFLFSSDVGGEVLVAEYLQCPAAEQLRRCVGTTQKLQLTRSAPCSHLQWVFISPGK